MESETLDEHPESNIIGTADIVINTNGRDAGTLFFVLETDGDFALIADGRCRLIEKPKRKKIKHLKKAAVPATRLSDKILTGVHITNAELRRTLRDISTIPPSNQ